MGELIAKAYAIAVLGAMAWCYAIAIIGICRSRPAHVSVPNIAAIAIAAFTATVAAELFLRDWTTFIIAAWAQ